MNNPIVKWPGRSREYSFEVLTMNSTWNTVPGVYIFCKETSPGRWAALYVGEASNFDTRLTINHEKWSMAMNRGATHVHACVVNGGELARKTIESDLILSLDPPLNQKLSVGLRPLQSR